MSGILKNLFSTLLQKRWEMEQMAIDTSHTGKTFNISEQKSAVIIIFGIATVLFSLIFTAYIYSIPPGQDTMYLLKPNLLWLNTTVLFFVSYFFYKITNDLERKETSKIKKNLIIVGGLSYLFLFGQIIFWMQLMKSGNFVTTNTYFSSFYVFTTLHGLHLLGGLFFWGRATTKLFTNNFNVTKTKQAIELCAIYWHFLLIVWFILFGLMVAS